jgi:hypothetical protein
VRHDILAVSMNRLPILPALAALALLPACEKKPTNTEASAERSKHSSRGDISPTVKPPIADTPAKEAPSQVLPPANQPAPKQSGNLADALALSDPAEREAAISTVLLNLPPADAADLALAELPDGAEREKAIGPVLTRFSLENPATAAAWLDKAPDFSGKPTAIRINADLWQRHDMPATLKWIDSLPPGNHRHSALDAIASRIALSPEEQRSRGLDAITNPELRAEVEALVVDRLSGISR